MTKPVTSTSVATNGADALAGSKPTRCRMKGSIGPVSEPNGYGRFDPPTLQALRAAQGNRSIGPVNVSNGQF